MLKKTITSLFASAAREPFKLFLVNNLPDHALQNWLADAFPEVEVINNAQPQGFSRNINQVIRQQPGFEYYLLLNPDALVLDRAVERAIEFIQDHPSVGILGCRVENPDGSLQRACRRSIPRPSVAFYRFSGLASLFPNSPRFAAYNYSYEPADRTHPVEAVSGSFLLFRHAVLETGGYLDETFFLYGEDLDFCLRASRAGWEVLFYPGARITHHKRGSSSRRPRESNFHFYDAMRIFYQKHFAPGAGVVERSLVLGGIRLLYLASRLKNSLSGVEEVGTRH